jgi:large subunit ribosomal protein L22
MLEKVLKSALANAEDRRAANLAHLIVTEARIDEGPQVKRMMPGSRGMAKMIKKRMAHIHVALEG